MLFSVTHIVGMVLVFAFVFWLIQHARSGAKSLEGFSVAGRQAGPWMVAGSLVGTIIGGSATIGTTQSAVLEGFSAWWFTVGSALGFLVLGRFFAGPLRESGLSTIAEFMSLYYGRAAGLATSVVSVLGIFFSLVSSGLAGIHFMQLLFPVSPVVATLLLIAVVVAYVLLGGQKGTAISGLAKTVLLYATLCVAGVVAYRELMAVNDPTIWSRAVFSLTSWGGTSHFMRNALSVVIGVVVTQSYAQAIYSASSSKSASKGAYIAAALCFPVGLPLIFIGLAMHGMMTSGATVNALVTFMLTHLPAWIGGLGVGAILLSIIGSIAGLSLGAATSIAVDIYQHGYKQENPSHVLHVLQIALVTVTTLAFTVSLIFYDSTLLYWNFLSFSLRGAGIFFPFILAILWRGKRTPHRIASNIACATMVAVLSIFFPIGGANPLMTGLGVSFVWLFIEHIVQRNVN